MITRLTVARFALTVVAGTAPFTLGTPLNALVLDDARVAHGVTEVTPIDPALPAHRDTFVVALRSTGSGG